MILRFYQHLSEDKEERKLICEVWAARRVAAFLTVFTLVLTPVGGTTTGSGGKPLLLRLL